MSKKTETAGSTETAGEAREVALLADCHAGAAGAVVTVTAEEAAALVSAGQADDNVAAVEYRKSVNAKAD
jgi:hypothetical protein